VKVIQSTSKGSYNCDKCKDNEWITYIDDNGLMDHKLCECYWINRKKEKIDRLIKASHITEEFQQKTFTNFDTKNVHSQIKKAHQVAVKYVKEFDQHKETRHNSIMLLGRVGAGKTHLLMAIANNLLANGTEVLYFPWVEGINEIKDDFDRLEERTKRLRECEVLYLDDIFKGREEPTAFQLEQLFGIINYRYLNKKPIMISSEKTIAELCEIDEGIGSRIFEMCRDYRVNITGDMKLNYRLRGMV